MIDTNFGKNIKKLRSKMNETQELLAMKLTVDKSAISHWEHGRRMPDDEMVKRIAEHFEVSVEELFEDVYEDNEREKMEKDICFYEFVTYPLPRIDIEKKRAYILFKEALRLDSKIIAGNGSSSEFIDMVHKYWEAFDNGVLDAGVNLLAHLFGTVLNAKSIGKEEHGLDNKINNLIEGLQLYNHPAGDYYEALWLLESLNGNGKDIEENFNNGLIRLYELADDGNEYAIAFVDLVESAQVEE